VGGPVIVGGHAQARDRSQQIVSIDISAHLAGGRRSLKKHPKGRPESLLEMRSQVFEGRISRMQSWGEPALGCNEGGISLHPICQCFERLVLGRKDRRGVRAGVHFATEDGCDEVSALGEVAVNSADTDAGFLCDLSHRCVYPRSCEHRFGRLKQRINVALSVGADTPIRAALGRKSITLVFRFVAHRNPAC
jgi:hypothetical protein